MYYENQQPTFKCPQLKNSDSIYSNLFWNNAVNNKMTSNGEVYQIIYVTDIIKL